MVIKMLWIKIKQGRVKIMRHNTKNQCEDLGFCTYAGKPREEIKQRETTDNSILCVTDRTKVWKSRQDFFFPPRQDFLIDVAHY